MRLDAANSGKENATAEDVRAVFADDELRGEYVRLEREDGDFLQAAGMEDDDCVLEYRVAATGEHKRAKGELTLSRVEETFVAYLEGGDAWRSRWQWEELPVAARGCRLTVLLWALGALGGSALTAWVFLG